MIFGLRVLIGALLLIAGALKVTSIVALASTIAAFKLLPAVLVAPMAVILPYFEIGLGLYLIAGLFTRIVAWVALAEFLLFSLAIASVVWRGIATGCGCFGPADAAPASWWDVGRDLCLVLLTLPIVLAPPGALAVDTLLAAKESRVS